MSDYESSLKSLFFRFYRAQTEVELEPEIKKAEMDFNVDWTPYGDNESYFGVIENQQASPIPALVEKITNSIDAILMKRCYEEGIDPKSTSAPKSIEDAISIFFQILLIGIYQGKGAFNLKISKSLRMVPEKILH